MNIQELDILKQILLGCGTNQRVLAEKSGYSLGTVNRCVRVLRENGYLTEAGGPSLKAVELADSCRPKNAIILAAGFGMRMVPINTETPKGLLEVKGELLVERTIKQLREAGIENISIVVGFMKEWYEYLTEQYGVRLISNRDYAQRNNLHSLALAAAQLENAYIIPCDIWCRENPYSSTEFYSWYMVGNWEDEESPVRVNRRRELVYTEKGEAGNAMIGISYVCGAQAKQLGDRLRRLDGDRHYNRRYWEAALEEKDGLCLAARCVNPGSVVEINTYEQLRELDGNSDNLKTDSLKIICGVLDAGMEEIKQIAVLKKGMTNRSFLFCHGDKKYIMRIPGEGTDKLIDREHEAAVYRAVGGLELCDHVLYINEHNGYKISEFIEGARCCDAENDEDVAKCMKHLRRLHQMGLELDHDFDIFNQIEFYESLRGGKRSAYRDYQKTKERVMALRAFVESCPRERCLSHIDAVPDNFLFYSDEQGRECIRLIDWEYSGMQDPHVDIAMFGIYSMYGREQMDKLISAYFDGACPEETRCKIYAYVAACGLLWSNWCEYKMDLGVDFGEYSIRQYAYAREYAKLVESMLAAKGDRADV